MHRWILSNLTWMRSFFKHKPFQLSLQVPIGVCIHHLATEGTSLLSWCSKQRKRFLESYGFSKGLTIPEWVVQRLIKSVWVSDKKSLMPSHWYCTSHWYYTSHWYCTSHWCCTSHRYCTLHWNCTSHRYCTFYNVVVLTSFWVVRLHCHVFHLHSFEDSSQKHPNSIAHLWPASINDQWQLSKAAIRWILFFFAMLTMTEISTSEGFKFPLACVEQLHDLRDWQLQNTKHSLELCVDASATICNWGSIRKVVLMLLLYMTPNFLVHQHAFASPAPANSGLLIINIFLFQFQCLSKGSSSVLGSHE